MEWLRREYEANPLPVREALFADAAGLTLAEGLRTPQPLPGIQYAIPRWERRAWNFPQGPLAAPPRWACRRCVARRTGTPGQGVMVWMSKHHDQVCIPQAVWIGQAVEAPTNQIDLADLPEIVAAQKHHYRPLRRYGPDVISACYGQTSHF
ncbi:hypothetical protein OG604_48005 [Streptomyces sp. NBC_01231]|nr:hypothetical protein OG604_48005 [Streptomyces sp. NBC_01231]